MARSKKTEDAEEVVENTVETKNDNSEIEAMKAQIEELKKMLANQTATVKTTDEVKHDYGSKYIKVVSLFDGVLNLHTEANAGGKLFTFNGIGKSWKILESDLRDVVMNNRSFFEKGYCYIADQAFIEDVGLDLEYEHILNAKEFIEVCKFHGKEAAEMFNNASDAQKENIVDILVRKIVAGEIPEEMAYQFDPNGKLKIQEKVNDSKAMLEAYNIDAKTDVTSANKKK